MRSLNANYVFLGVSAPIGARYSHIGCRCLGTGTDARRKWVPPFIGVDDGLRRNNHARSGDGLGLRVPRAVRTIVVAGHPRVAFHEVLESSSFPPSS